MTTPFSAQDYYWYIQHTMINRNCHTASIKLKRIDSLWIPIHLYHHQVFDLLMPTYNFHANCLYLIIDPVAFLGNSVLKCVLAEVRYTPY